MIKKIIATAAIAMALSGSAFAQDGKTCATAIPIGSDSNVKGNTSEGGNAIDVIGGLPLSNAKSLIYSFTAKNVDATLNMSGAYDWGIFVTPSCSAGIPSFITLVTSTDSKPMLDLSALPSGTFVDGRTYYVIVSRNPGAGSVFDGPFDVVVDGTLPVALQNFSID